MRAGLTALLAAVLATGCALPTAAPGLSLRVRATVAAPAARALMAERSGWTRDEVDHVMLTLTRLGPPDSEVGSHELTDPDGDFAFTNLKPDTDYRVDAVAYSEDAEPIGSASTTVETGTEDQLEAVSLTIQLDNRVFSGQAGLGTVAIHPAGLAAPGTARVVAAPSAMPGPSFGAIAGLAADGRGNAYVVDLGERQVCKVAPDGQVTVLAGPGLNFTPAIAVNRDGSRIYVVNGFGDVRRVTGGGAVAVPGMDFIAGGALAMSPSGALYVAEVGPSERLVRVALDGAEQVVASGFGSINALAVDARENVYVADDVGRAIHVVTPGGAVSTLALRDADGAPFTLDADVAGLAFDGERMLLAIDGSAEILVLAPDGRLTPFASPPGPLGAIAAATGTVFAYETAPANRLITLR